MARDGRQLKQSRVSGRVSKLTIHQMGKDNRIYDKSSRTMKRGEGGLVNCLKKNINFNYDRRILDFLFFSFLQ